MSSYQHQCMLENVIRGSMPDYLTCGYCAKEFLLDNITLFIAHKTGGCDPSSHFRSAPLHEMEDTATPLTCSVCSRVFMTARGLLHHVQEDHQMVLCLQKGPLFLPHQKIQPPPAHASCTSVESSRAHADHSACCFPDSVSSCGQTDEPTDLSMTCSNSLGKARVTCNEDKCQITLQPTSSVTPAKCPSALPKKRKFVCQHQNVGFTKEPCVYPADGSCRSRTSDGQDEADSKDSCGHHSETTSGKETDENDVSICVTAEYQKDTLCCVSLSTEKKEHEKHAQLKRLLQNTNQSTECEELPQQGSDDKTTTVVYKVPFLVPQDPDSAVLKVTASVKSSKDILHQNCPAVPKEDVHVAAPNKSNAVSRLTMETTIDRLIRSSISSDSFSELNILPLQSESSPFNSKQTKHHTTLDSDTPIPASPHLLMPGEITTAPAHISFSSSTFSGSDKSCGSPSLEHWNTLFLGDVQSPQAVSGLTSVIASSFQTGKSLLTDIAQNERFQARNSLAFADISTQRLGKANFNVYSGLPLTRNHRSDQLPKQESDHSTTLGEGLLKLLKHQKPSHRSKRQPFSLEPLVSTTADLTDGNQSIQQWLTNHNEDSSSFAVTGPTLRSPGSERLDPVLHDNADETSADIFDDAGMDSKGIKRRRYPTSRPFKCPSCDQAFNQRIHLKKHMSKHTGVKPFKCQQCDYSTVERSHLKVHYRIHTGEKPYRCMFCDYATAQNSTLKIHMKRHHDNQLTPDCNSVRDNNSQPTGSFDDVSWTLQDSVFLHSSLNNPTFDDELNRANFLSEPSIVQSMITENALLGNGQRDGDTRRRSSSPTSSSDKESDHPFFGTSMQQSHTAASLSDKMLFVDAGRMRRKSAFTSRDHYDNNSVLKNKNSSTAAAVEPKFSSGQDMDNLSCHGSEDSINFRDNSESGLYKDIKRSPVQVFIIQNKDQPQHKTEDLNYFNSQRISKSSSKRKHVPPKSNIHTIKSIPQTSDKTAYSVTEKDTSKETKPTHFVNSRTRVESDAEKTFNEVNMIGSSSSQELVGATAEDDGYECNTMDIVSVTVPSKAFVRG